MKPAKPPEHRLSQHQAVELEKNVWNLWDNGNDAIVSVAPAS